MKILYNAQITVTMVLNGQTIRTTERKDILHNAWITEVTANHKPDANGTPIGGRCGGSGLGPARAHHGRGREFEDRGQSHCRENL
jgi:hypothetical protein